jgi:hypothetical protein
LDKMENQTQDEHERRVIVEGFDERGGGGGILKLKEQGQEAERRGYSPWVQTAAWFNETGKSELKELKELKELVPLRNYREVRGEIAKACASLKSLHDKDSDYERLKARADLFYLKGEYTACIAAWLAIMAQYKLGKVGVAGGLRLEALDSLARCFLHVDVECVCEEEAAAVLEDLAAAAGATHHTALLAVHSRLLLRAARYGGAVKAAQELARAYPADPGHWLHLAETYRMAHAARAGLKESKEEENGRAVREEKEDEKKEEEEERKEEARSVWYVLFAGRSLRVAGKKFTGFTGTKVHFLLVQKYNY